MTRLASLAVASLVACLAGCATSPPPLTAGTHDDPHPGSVQIIKAHCDDNGAVDDMVIHSDGAGTVGLRWSNKSVCGAPA